MSAQVNSGSIVGTRRSRKVAVIGAGAAGLVAARELRAEGHAVTVLEQSNDVGGVWRYDPRIESTDPMGADPDRPASARVHSSMYVNLRTNLPREVMSFSDFPFDAAFLGPRYSSDPRRFCGHKEVLGYLEAFADYYGLRPLVRTCTRVLGVEPATPDAGASTAGAAEGSDSDISWLVTSERLESNQHASSSSNSNSNSNGRGACSGGDSNCGSVAERVQQELYDAVVVCNGHYSEPRLPRVRGMDGGPGGFPGQQLHSHNYRAPEQWRDKTVLVVGASNSGEDVSRELSAAGARRVLLAAREWKDAAAGPGAAPYGPGGNIYRFPMVSELHADGCAAFEDGRREGPIDAVIYCTGYRYNFPFLRGAAAAAAKVLDNCVGPLWMHMLPPGPLAPSLSFIGLPWKVVPFPQAELQSKYVARLLSGRVQLPTRGRMEADITAHYEAMRAQGLPFRYAHMQGLDQFPYNASLAALCGPDVPPLPAWREQLYRATSALKRAQPDNYRDGNLGVAGRCEDALSASLVWASAQAELLQTLKQG